MVKYVVKMAGEFRDKIVVRGWKSLTSLLLKATVCLTVLKTKIGAIKFLKVRLPIHFDGGLRISLKEAFPKLYGLLHVTGSIATGAIRFITHIPAGLTVTGEAFIWIYKLLARLMESNIAIVGKIGVALYAMFFVNDKFGVGVVSIDVLFKKVMTIDNDNSIALGGKAKVKSSNLPFYLKHLDPIKLHELDSYTLKELDGNM